LSPSGALDSVLASLIDNALRSIRGPEAGYVKIVVTDKTRLLEPNESTGGVDARASGSNVNVAFIIEDNGVGMSPEFLATGYFRPMHKQVSREEVCGMRYAQLNKRMFPGRVRLGFGVIDSSCAEKAAIHSWSDGGRVQVGWGKFDSEL
jgi:hypothetical protein